MRVLRELAVLLVFVAGMAGPGAGQTGSENPTGYENESFYYGWRGLKEPLWLSTQQIGIAFAQYADASSLHGLVAAVPDIELPLNHQPPAVNRRFSTAVVNIRAGLPRDRVQALVRTLQSRSAVRAALPVYYSLRGKPSLLTEYLSVVVDLTVPEGEVRALFEREKLAVVGVEQYPELGKVSYRLWLTPAARALAGDETFTTIAMANRLRRIEGVIEAAPMFTPLYPVQTSVVNPYPDRSHPPTEFSTISHWNLQLTKVDEAWEAIKLHAGPLHETVVAMLDNGVWMDYRDNRTVNIDGTNYVLDTEAGTYVTGPEGAPDLLGHFDLNPRQWINAREAAGGSGQDDDPGPLGSATYVDDFYGWDFVGTNPYVTAPTLGDNIPFPDDTSTVGIEVSGLIRHGTYASGIACALGNNSLGVAGITWTAKVLPVRYHLQTYSLSGGKEALADVYYCWRAEKAIRYAADKGAHVIALMMAVETYDPGVRAAVEYAWSKGCFIAASAGNDNKSLDAAPLFPHAFPEVVTVGSSQYLIENGVLEEKRDDHPTEGSNYGLTLEVVAPVRKVENGVLSLTPGLNINATHDGIQASPGTSSAMPQVAGLAALLLSVKPTLSPLELRHIICSTADDIGVPGRDVFTGYGRINAAAAVYAALQPRFSVLDEVEDTTIPRQKAIFSIDADGDVFFDGNIQQNAPQASLLADNIGVGEFFVRDHASGNGLLRLSPGGVDAQTLLPFDSMLYLKSDLQWVQPGGIAPSSGAELLFRNSAGAYVARLLQTGRFQYTGYLHTAADLDPPYYMLAPYENALRDFVARVELEGLQNAVAIVPPRAPGEPAYNSVNFNGNNIVFRSTNPFDRATVESTVISGNSAGSAVTFAGTETENAGLLGFTITGGNATNGGGILGNGAKAHIMYNIIVGNTATNGGGAIHGCTGMIEHNVIGGNEKGNSAAGGFGGALHSCDGAYIRKNRITHNSARDGGGAIWECDDAYIAQNYIAENNGDSNNAGAGYGGGIAGCDLAIIRGNIFYGNSAAYGGALAICSNSIIEHNTVYGNTATADGGGGGLFYCTATNGNTLNACILYANTPNQFDSANPTTCFIQGYPTQQDSAKNFGGAPNESNPAKFVNYTDPTVGLGLFLHLDADSTCIDKVEYDRFIDESESTRFRIRDFDDQVGPCDYVEYKPALVHADIGADEYPTQESVGFPYWWEVLN